WPLGPSTWSSTRLARPFQTLLTTVVPSYSSQVVEPVRGWSKRRRCVFQRPISKSKSCWPSRSTVELDRPRLAPGGFARACGCIEEYPARIRRPSKKQDCKTRMGTPFLYVTCCFGAERQIASLLWYLARTTSCAIGDTTFSKRRSTLPAGLCTPARS